MAGPALFTDVFGCGFDYRLQKRLLLFGRTIHLADILADYICVDGGNLTGQFLLFFFGLRISDYNMERGSSSGDDMRLLLRSRLSDEIYEETIVHNSEVIIPFSLQYNSTERSLSVGRGMRKQEECIAIYSRKSRFTGKGESIENQVELCREYILTHYGEAALETVAVYEDEGFSGGNLNRPDFKNMMDAARKRKLKAIIVYRLDRISRNISDFAGLIEELSHLGVAFVSIKEQFDTGSPMGRAMMYIASVFSQLERETIAERIRDNMHELAKTGRWLGGTTPTGYRSEAVESVSVDGKIKKACRLTLIPEEAETIRLIYDLYMEFDSQTVTEAELLKRGVRTKNGRYFTRFAIRSILQNPVYAMADCDTYEYFMKVGADLFSDAAAFDGVHGMMVYNRTSQEKGKTTEYLPTCEWIAAVGRHPGIIPGNLWVSVQESLERNKVRSYHKPRKNQALLTGLLYCSCGSRMYPKSGRSRAADGTPSSFYVCKMKERSRRSLCAGKNVNGNLLDAAVMGQVRELSEDRETFIRRLEQSRRLYGRKQDGRYRSCRKSAGPDRDSVGQDRDSADRSSGEDYMEAMRQKRADMEKKIGGLVDSLADLKDGAARRRVAERIEQLNLECRRLEDNMTELERQAGQNKLSGREAEQMCRTLCVWENCVDRMTVGQRRDALRKIISEIIWDGESAQILLSGGRQKV